MRFYSCCFTDEETEAGRGFVSNLEELSCEQWDWPQSIIPNRYLRILIFNDNITVFSHPFNTSPLRCTFPSGYIPVHWVRGDSQPHLRGGSRQHRWLVKGHTATTERGNQEQKSEFLTLGKCQRQMEWPECFTCKQEDLGLGFLNWGDLWIPPHGQLTSFLLLKVPFLCLH